MATNATPSKIPRRPRRPVEPISTTSASTSTVATTAQTTKISRLPQWSSQPASPGSASKVVVDPRTPAIPQSQERTAQPISLKPAPISKMATEESPSKIPRRPGRALELVPPGSSSEGTAQGQPIVNNNSNVNQVSGYGNTITNNNPITINYVLYGGIPAETDTIQIKISANLKLRHVPQAVYNAQLGSGCMEGTRVKILQDIINWIKDPNGQSIFWLTGWAGTGKSAISWTICSRANDDPDIVLGGSFFCSRSASLAALRDVRCIVPTLAQLMARQSTTFSQALADELDRDPDVLHKHISVQIEKLISKPLLALKSSPVPIVFVIDALDECGGQPSTDSTLDEAATHRVVSEMLEALVTFSNAEAKAPVKFVVTSRPETHIRDSRVSDGEFSEVLRLHTIDKGQVAADINLYISAKLLHTSNPRARFTQSEVDLLARICDDLFIVATTALQYILGGGADGARKRFRALLNPSGDGLSSGAAAPLDQMYSIVLKDAARIDTPGVDDMPGMLQLLATLLSARMLLSVAALADLLASPLDDVRATLGRLHAVVHVPDDDGEPGLRTVHASFGDYLFSRAPNRIRVSQTLGHEGSANGCFRIMSESLHFNISQSRSSYEPNSHTRPDGITPSVEYACTQWAYHIVNVPQASELEKVVDDFLRRQFMFWLEVMSVLGQVHRATAILLLATKALKSPGLVRFLRDANIFVASSQAVIERSAPHIYLSALPFTDRDSLIYRTFAPLYIGLISVSLFYINPHGGRHIMTLRGHERGVTSVCYSPDGLLIVSGSRDGTVRIWDALTGEETMPPLLSGNEPVQCVAMALTGETVAVGTAIGTVWLWNIRASGSTQPHRLLGSSESSISVAFSSDSGLIASLCSQGTVHVWSAETGEVLAVLSRLISEPRTVSFSSEGHIVVSNSSDWTIKDPVGGNRSVTLPSGRFSPNGKFMVSAEGHSVSLWTREDAFEWSLVSLGGHTNTVHSAVFSPNALYIASASDDGTIRIWSTEGSEAAVHSQPKALFRSGVKCISARGVHIASADQPPTEVRVSNLGTGEWQFQLSGVHAGRLLCMAISSKGLLVALGWSYGTIWLWDASTGEIVVETLPDHAECACWIAFTPDTRWLAFISKPDLCISGKPPLPYALHVWDVVHRRESTFGPIYVHRLAATAAISSDARCVAVPGTSGADTLGGFQLWESKDGATILKHVLGEGLVGCLLFSPDDSRIMTAGEACDSCVWNVSTGELIFMLKDYRGRFIAYSPDGQSIGTVSDANVVCLWDAETGALTSTLSVYHFVKCEEPDPEVNRMLPLSTVDVDNLVGFTADGASVVSMPRSGWVKVWDMSMARSLHSGSASDVDVLASATLDDGWLIGPLGELLVWVPAAYRPYLQLPPCTRRYGIQSVHLSVSDEGWHQGENWTACRREGVSDAVTNTL